MVFLVLSLGIFDTVVVLTEKKLYYRFFFCLESFQIIVSGEHVSSRFIPMDLLYPGDSYPGSDVSYPLFDQFVPNPLVDSYATTWHKMFKTNVNIYFISPSNGKTIKMHARTHKVYVWSYLLYCWTLLNNESVSGLRKVNVICFSIVYTFSWQ